MWPHGYAYFNYTPKQTLRLIESFLRVIDGNSEQMALVCTADEARTVVAEGRIAVILAIESGFDHEGDVDVLRALHRLGLRVVQFATQTCFNAYADGDAGGPRHLEQHQRPRSRSCSRYERAAHTHRHQPCDTGDATADHRDESEARRV
jgi:hypothetical protein